MAAFGGDTIALGSASAGGPSAAPSTGGAFSGDSISLGSSPSAPAAPKTPASSTPATSTPPTQSPTVSTTASIKVPDTSNLFSNFTSLNNFSIPKQSTDTSTEEVNTQPTVTAFGHETLAGLPEGSQKVSSAINNAVIKTPADLLASTPYMKDVGVGMSQNPSDQGSLFATDLLHRLSAGLETVTGATGGAYQSPIDQTTDAATSKAQTSAKAFNDAVTAAGPQPDGPMSPALQKLAAQAQKDADDAKATGPEDLVDTGVRAISNGLGMAVAVGLGIQGASAVPGVAGALATFENLTAKLPLVGKYAAPFVKPLLTNAAGFAAYGQLDPNLADNIQARTKTFVTDMAEAPIYTALGALKNPAISLPASFGLGYGMALLSGATQQQAVTSGAAFAFLDGAGRADGTRPILSQDEMYAKLTDEAQKILSQHSGMKVTNESTAAELKTAWRMAAHQTHPDLGGNASDFTAAKNAYDFLTKAKTSIATEDTSTQESIRSLKGGVQKTVDTFGPENAVHIVKDELGLDSGTAGRLVRGSLPAPVLPKTEEPAQITAFGGAPIEPLPAGALTKYDTPAVIKARASMSEIKHTSDITTAVRTVLRNQLEAKAYGDGALKKEKRLDIVTGAPGTRKSSMIAQPLASEHGSILADSDQIKRMLPEYGEHGEGTHAVHKESAIINAAVLTHALERGDNIVYPTVGDKIENLNKIIDRAREKGYEVHLHNAQLAPEKAIPGTVARFESGEQGFVDPEYQVNQVGLKPSENHAILKDDERLQTTQQYDTDVERGQKPNLLQARGEGSGRLSTEEQRLEQQRSVEGSSGVSGSSVDRRNVQPRGFVNPLALADETAQRIAQIQDYIEKAEKTTALTNDVSDSIYAHEGQRKANRQRAIQILDEQGGKLTSEQWEKLYHHDENSNDEKLTPQEQDIYDHVIVPIKKALTTARTEYRNLGGHITDDMQMEHTPRYAKEKGGPIDRLLQQIKKVENGEKGIANGGLMSKSVAGGAKHRIFFALTDESGKRSVVSIPNAKNSRVTAFNKNVLSDLGPKSGKVGDTFTDEKGNVYTIDQATTKEIEANTNTRYHKNVLANYILAYDRQTNSLSAIKFINALTSSGKFDDIIMKEDPEGEPPPADWKDLGTVMPQFRGYYAEPKLGELLEDLGNRLKGRDEWPVFDQVNNILTSLIVMNPIMHTPNIVMGAASAKAAQGNLSLKSAANFSRAIDAVKNKDELYLSYLEHGAPFMALKQTTTEFTKAVLTQYAENLEKDEDATAVSKLLGYTNPLQWGKALSHLNETMTWGTNDIFFMHAILDYADQRGLEPLEAIKEVSKRMADYRIPSRIGPGKIGRAFSRMAQSRFFLFSRYHYSGVIKPWIESIKDSAGKNSTWRDRRSGVRAMAYLGIMALLVYPYFDKMLRGITGNPNTYITNAGATRLIQTAQKAVSDGVQQGVPAALQSILQLNPALYGALELGFNVDLFTRDPIYGGHANDEGLSSWGTSMVAPLADAARLNATDFALSMFGVYSPKNTSGANTLNSMKYDELPALQVQVKKDEVAGLTSKAQAEMKDFNDRAVAAYNEDQLSKGLKPLTQEQLPDFLKQWGIKGPGVVAMTNASKLYGDGALATKQTFLQKITKYAEAVGIDPVEAFDLVLSGQHVQKVDNFSILGPDASIIVVRAPLAYTEGVRQSEAASNGTTSQLGGLQLDHFIPLEAGGTNDEQNLDLITTQQNESLNSAIETPIAAALKNGQISNAKVLEYITRYKIGTLHEVPNQYYLDLYKNQYLSAPITVQEVIDNIKNGNAK